MGNAGRVQALIAGGVNINARDEDGMTALHHAAGSGARDCLRLLLATDQCDVLIRDIYGRSASELGDRMGPRLRRWAAPQPLRDSAGAIQWRLRSKSRLAVWDRHEADGPSIGAASEAAFADLRLERSYLSQASTPPRVPQAMLLFIE